MFIEKGTDKEIPKDAIRLTREEVFEYMTDLIHKWPSSTDMSVELAQLRSSTSSFYG